ncbi:RagB/SusD family nutrient uptake outer membrane protein [Larkinella rosea]|uniref:RagB/SusD family nutrient uptake outer membrane protein n=1 Tax=Larkinella rosea TaxID=2025312 RepID=A0A3P1B9V7_9BACT|nr:RagB/SusD family nutrient uptake outer membrane protein [Larkinella rosea]RRA97741.1 RagB/SusD family nutrient uptake outer membrane protein [Larkinella rosea]
MKYSILTLFLAAFLVIGCKEDFITKEFTNGVSEENFFKNTKDVEQALTAVYDVIGQKGIYRESVFVLGSCPSDDIDEKTGDTGDYGFHFKNASDFRWFPDNPFSKARWYDAYKGIFRANTFLEKVPPVTMDETLKKQYLAEARFLRAVYYWNLVITFGDVPFFTKVLTQPEYADLARTDKAVIYKQIEDDMNAAIPDLLATASNPVGRVTKGAAMGFLGRIYLYEKKWQEAADMAQKVIALGQYRLVPNYISLFNGKAENSSESLMDFQSVGFSPGYFNDASENSIAAMWSPTIGWANWYTPSEESKTLFVPGDIRRKSVMIMGASPADSIDVDGTGPKVFPTLPMRTQYFNNANVRKFLPDGKIMAQVDNFDVNYPIIRYAEVLLNHAEALNELGRSADALASLNQVRARAKVANVTETNQASLRTIIQNERRVELVYEGHRFYDLARWGQLEEKLKKKGFVKGQHEYWPVPTAELDLMKKLTQYPAK